MTEEIRPLELLHRVASRLESVVCLTSTADARDPVSLRRLITRHDNAKLLRLTVVKPCEDGRNRWDVLSRGRVICSQIIGADDRLDDVADLLLVILGPLVRT